MKLLRLVIVLCLIFSLPIMATYATCTPSDTGTAGNDTIDCTVTNSPVADVEGQAGDDTITIGAGVTTNNDVSGGNTTAVAESGNDTITNDGTVIAIIYGDSFNGNGSGNDTIVNNGSAQGGIFGDTRNGVATGNDIIINNGDASGGIYGDSYTGAGNGSDYIVNNGTVGNDVIGDSRAGTSSGNDTIINNGSANGLSGDSRNGAGSGNDNIVNNGTVSFDVYGDTIFNTGSGNDTIINNGGVGGSIAGDADTGVGSGNDILINNGNVNVDMYGDSIFNSGTGDDTIINNGYAGSMAGDTQSGLIGSGDDVVINNGTVINIYGDNSGNSNGTGNDLIVTSGTVTGAIIASGGNDTVVIAGNNATVGGLMDGGTGYDVLTFSLSSTDPAQLQSWAEQIAAANPNGGTLMFNGHSYTWLNFEELTQLLFTLNPFYRGSFAVFCHLGGGIDVYAINGQQGSLAFSADAQALSNGIAQGANGDFQISASQSTALYALTTGELQVNGSDSTAFTFRYDTYCGILPEAHAVMVEEQPEEELPPYTIINQPYGG